METIQLNQYQQEAVQDESNACLVNANVGSGKTTVLIEKIRFLHTEKKIAFQDMFVLTFTNKAAGEIQERLREQQLVSDREEMLFFGTFHAVALNLLQKYLPVEELGYREGFRVMTPEEELEMALQLITEHGLKIKYKNRMKKRLDQERASGETRVRYQDDWKVLMTLLEAEKHRQNQMTYADLLKNATELLERHPETIRAKWVIIDEVQDCDHSQMLFLEQLKKPETHLFAVGDPNQVIYSWRGSVFQIFPLLRMKYQAREVSLPVNYRSTGTILEAAKRFLQNGSHLEGCREAGQKIVIKNHYDPFQEADYLSGRIRELHKHGIPYGEIAVFYRMQNQSEILEKAFTREGIPCEVSVKKSMQDIPVLAWFFHVLKSALYPENKTDLLLALCDKQYGEGWTQKRAEKELAKAGKTENNQTAESGYSNKGFSGNQMMEKMSLLLRIQYMPEVLPERASVKVMSGMLPDLLALQMQILPTSAAYKEEMEQVQKVLEILCREICRISEKKPDEEISRQEWITAAKNCLNDIALAGMRIEDEKDSQTDTVKFMTLHASKGLEFSHVFLIGVNNGLIPLLSGGMESEEEERRLFFVGMTRAKEYLELSWYTSPDGPRVMPGPGRFLRFLPDRLVEYPEGKPESVRSRSDAQAHLQSIRKRVEKNRIENADAGCAGRKEKSGIEIQADNEAQAVGNMQTGIEAQAVGNMQTDHKALASDREKTGTVAPQSDGQNTVQAKRVRHARYGVGEIVEENDMQIIVEFKDYGRKEFIRQFAMLEEI